MPNETSNIFAIVDDEQTPIRRIPLTGNLQSQIKSFFDAQTETFITDKQEIEFTGSYNVDIGELFFVPDFPIPENFSAAIQNPLNNPVLNLNQETHRIKALFSGVWNQNKKQISFQVFDSGKVLSKGITLLNSGDTFKKLEDPGLILQDKLTAHYQDGKLLFTSYHNTKRFIDLSQYYEAATDTDLEDFADSELFEFEDESSFMTNADSVVRKKIALLQQNHVLDDLSVNDIKTVSDDFNQHVADEHKIDITINDDGKLVIPKDKQQLKELIRFLDEDYVTAPLTKRRCLTNSKKYL